MATTLEMEKIIKELQDEIAEVAAARRAAIELSVRKERELNRQIRDLRQKRGE